MHKHINTFFAYLILTCSQDFRWMFLKSPKCSLKFLMWPTLSKPPRRGKHRSSDQSPCSHSAARDSLHRDSHSHIHQYSRLQQLTLTVNSALQLKPQCLWRAKSIIAEAASLRRGPTLLSKCTQGLVWLPLNSLLCTVRANLSCMKQEMVLLWQQSTF